MKRALIRVLVPLLAAGVCLLGALLLLSPEARARPALQSGELTIAKVESRDPVEPGARLVYTLTYRNNSTTTLTGVVVTDTLDPALIYVTASPTPTGGLPDAPFWSIGTLSPSVSGQIVLTVDVTSPLTNGAVLTNTARIGGDGVEAESASVTTTVAAPVLALAQRDSPDPVVAGATLTYTIAYTNTGDANATGVVITDLLDSRVVFLSASPPAGGTGRTRTWTLGALAPDTGGQIVVRVTVQNGLGEGTLLSNVVSMDSLQTTPFTVTEATTVRAHGDPVAVTLTPDGATRTAGQTITYTLTAQDAYGNAWDVTASGTYTITPAAGGTWAANVYTTRYAGTWTVTGSYAGHSDTARLTVQPAALDHIIISPDTATINAGSTQAYTAQAFDVFGNSRGDVTAQTTFSIVESGHGGSWLGNVYTSRNPGTWTVRGAYQGCSDDATLTVLAPVLNLRKSDSPDPVQAGANLTYTLVYSNTGNQTATSVVVRDTLDPHLDYLSATPSPSGFTSGNPYWNRPSLAPGGVAQIVLRVRARTPLTNNLLLNNVATVDCAETDPVTATQSTTVRSAPQLSLTQVDAPDPVEAGASLVYTLTYRNTGNEVATNVIITDQLDSHVSYVSASPPSQGSGRTRIWSIGNLPPGAPVSIRVTVAVASPLPNGTILTNTVWLDSAQTDPLLSTARTTVHSRPVLSVSKSDDPDPVTAGELLYYTVVIANTGNENATSVVVTEDYDPRVSFAYANPSPDSGTGNRVWSFATLPAGEERTISIIVRVASPLPVGTVLTNTVWLDSDQTTPLADTEQTRVLSQSNLRISQVDNPDPVSAGEDLYYAITYSNNGTANATGVVITDTYDSRVTYVSATPPPSVGNNVWNIGNLPVGGSGTILVRVRVRTPLPNGSLLANRVAVDSAETDPASFVETTGVTSAPALAFDASARPEPVAAGAVLTYTLRYTNTGNADATHTVITATLDPNTSLLSATPEPAEGSGRVWIWRWGAIAGEGGHGQVVIRAGVVSPLENGTLLNFVAQLADVEGDLLSDGVQSTVTSAPALSIQQSDGQSTVRAGERLTLTLTTVNSGNENAYKLVITDTLPDLVTYLGCQADGGSCEELGNVVVIRYPTLVGGRQRQAQVIMQVDDPLPPGVATITHHAVLNAPCLAAPIVVEDEDSVTTRPDLALSVWYTPTLYSPGRLMTYIITYGNSGRMEAADVILTTTLPTGTTFVGSGWQTGDGRIYSRALGTLPAGEVGRVVTFTVLAPNQPSVPAPLFDTPFVIAERNGVTWDEQPANNTTHAVVGVPDLVVREFTVEPLPLHADTPVTFTIVVENRGTGMAWNPDNHGGFWVDIFIDEIPPYPWIRYSEKDLFDAIPPLAPGVQGTVVITHSGFSTHEIHGEIVAFYAKVDNHEQYPYGLVPESDEMNNVAGPVLPGFYYAYLPLVQRLRR